MAGIEPLVKAYADFVALPWQTNLAPPQRIWMVVYAPREERRIRVRLQEFEIATLQAGHTWSVVDLTDEFAHWLSRHDYRDAYFASPELLDASSLEEFGDHLCARVISALTDEGVDQGAVVALIGVGSLFSFYRVSRLLERVAPSIRGRLLVLFPGDRDGSNYRMLEAQDGWNYLATPIAPTEDMA
jgi:hypothetical protein